MAVKTATQKEALFISHYAPERAASSLISVHPGKKIDIKALPRPIHSTEIMSKYSGKGLKAEEVALPIYGSNLGRPRRFDQQDLISGKENLYSDLSEFAQVWHHLAGWINHWTPKMLESGIIGSMEMQDLDKITVQQFKWLGYFLEPPCRDTAQPGTPSSEWLQALDAVARRYAAAIPDLLDEARHNNAFQLILMDNDPPDTMVGLPTLQSGDKTAEARYATLAAYPDPSGLTPAAFLGRVDAEMARYGFSSGESYSAVVATRLGPIKPDKFLPLWEPVSGGYVSRYEASGLYNRVRHVFPASYPMNFLLSPYYVLLSEARKRILGLWHTPDLMEKYIEKMRAQGRFSYAVDFSAMDMHIMPIHVKLIMKYLIKYGFPRWQGELMIELMDRMGVFYPSYLNQTRSVTKFHGNFGWFSGWKLTAEVDTLFGAATLLSILEQLKPGTIKEWESGKFVFSESGDDILFTAAHEMDTDRVKELGIQLAGAELKAFPDAVFLKKFLPVVPEVPSLTRPMSRFIQQTFFNEERYTGVEGGTRPDAVLRFALYARSQYLERHPYFKEMWNDLLPAVLRLGFVQRAPQSYRDALVRRDLRFAPGDDEALLLYSQRATGYFARIAERAKYEPSAAQLMQLLAEDANIPFDQITAEQQATRRLLFKVLFQKPTLAARRSLDAQMTWLKR